MESVIRINHEARTCPEAFGITSQDSDILEKKAETLLKATTSKSEFCENLWKTFTEREIMYFIATYGGEGLQNHMMMKMFSDAITEKSKKDDIPQVEIV